MTNVTATVVFDSWLDSAPERRSGRPADRHLIYEGGGILLDLLLKQTGQESCLQVGGQILCMDASTGSVAGIVVQVNSAGQCFATQTNALGEFSFQSVPRLSLELYIVLLNQRICVRGLTLDEPHLWQVTSMMAAGGGL